MRLNPDSEFVTHVLDIVDSIPSGRVMTYGDVAAVLGSRAARAVGTIMSQYGEDVPWWRVIRSGGHPPAEHDDLALPFYLAEGTPLVRKALSTAYRIDYAVARWSPV